MLKRYCGPNSSKAAALVSILSVEAGISGVPAWFWKRVSPRVSEMAIAPNCPLRTFPTIDPRSALSAAADRGDVAVAVGTAGAARRTGLRVAFRVGFFAGFFAGRLRAVVVCFFAVVCDVESIGATASVVSRITARALSLR